MWQPTVEAFPFQKRCLPFQSPAVTAQAAVLTNHPVVGYYQGHGGCGAGLGHGAGGPGFSQGLGYLSVGPGFASGNRRQVLPNSALEGGSPYVQGQCLSGGLAVHPGQHAVDPLLKRPVDSFQLGNWEFLCQPRFQGVCVIPQVYSADAPVSGRHQNPAQGAIRDSVGDLAALPTLR